MKRLAFTLIELLVVIAVIAMLLGILMPVLRKARQQAKAVVCTSNLRQLSLAMAAYEHENNTFPYGLDASFFPGVPPPGGKWAGTGSDFRGWWWFHFLSDILGENFAKDSILRCPSRNAKDSGFRENILCGNYGVNRAVCKDSSGIKDSEFVGDPLGLNQVPNPAKTLFITDSGYSLISWKAAAELSGPLFENTVRENIFYLPGLKINKKRNISSNHRQDAVSGRHPNKTINIGFVDGHVAQVKAGDLFVKKNGSGYVNLYPLWIPGK